MLRCQLRNCQEGRRWYKSIIEYRQKGFVSSCLPMPLRSVRVSCKESLLLTTFSNGDRTQSWIYLCKPIPSLYFHYSHPRRHRYLDQVSGCYKFGIYLGVYQSSFSFMQYDVLAQKIIWSWGNLGDKENLDSICAKRGRHPVCIFRYAGNA